MSKIREKFTIDGVLKNVTSCKLSVKRNDNDDVIVADGTDMTNISTGIYEYEFTDPDYNLEYTYWVEWVYDGETHRDEFTKNGPVSAAACPLTLAEAKLHLRVDGDDENDLISQIMLAATDFAENYQQRTYISRSRILQLDKFELIIRPPYPPLVTVDSIEYVDINGVMQTLDPAYYRVDVKNQPGRITEAYGYCWPSILNVTGAVTINYTAGYGEAADVPSDIKAVIKMLIQYYYERNNEEGLFNQAKELLWMKKIVNV